MLSRECCGPMDKVYEETKCIDVAVSENAIYVVNYLCDKLK